MFSDSHSQGVVMDIDAWNRGRLIELSAEECRELLATKRVGRVAYVGPDGLEVVPLNFITRDDAILLRTAPHSMLGRCSAHLDTASFQVDEIDDFTESGWSVLVRGSVDRLDIDDLPPTDRRPLPWPEGQRTLYLRMVPRVVTGRRLIPG